MPSTPLAESARLDEDARRIKNWKRWGPYLAERQWATVREDYSASGDPWLHFPHAHARSRAYRWGEDGLLGITDRECRLCFALALWNERDPILKERLFGLTNLEGNHGEDVKECYFYLDSTPTHSYMKALYKYPQSEFPYERLVEENRRRTRLDPEFELEQTGIFDANRYFDVFAEYAKAAPDDILVRITIANRRPEAAPIHVLPVLWFRNTWAWGQSYESSWGRPSIVRAGPESIEARHSTLGTFHFEAENAPAWLFTENQTNVERLYNAPNSTPFVKDAFHDCLIQGRADAAGFDSGTKAAAHYRFVVPPGGSAVIRCRLFETKEPGEFDSIFARRIAEANEFYAALIPPVLSHAERRTMRHAYAGLLWTKQFYHYVIAEWLEGDPALPPPEVRKSGRNHDWPHLFNRDILSMPDKWDFPWYAAWDLGFHMLPFASLDHHFAKEQLVLLLREWYMHPNGHIPAYEFNFSDVNPPVHAWAAWRVYKIDAARGRRDRRFLERVFQKLLLNFTWWVNRKDPAGNNLFTGGFLGLDNIGAFDRSTPLPNGGHLNQADGTAWMAFYCSTMLSIALELACEDPVYEDLASKFFEHFVAIADAMNTLGGTGLWDETDGFYYDQIRLDGHVIPLQLRSMVGIIPLFAVEILEEDRIDRLPGFSKRMRWFLEHRKDLAAQISYLTATSIAGHRHRLLAIPSRERLTRVLRYLLDENEFLSPYGIRSLSRIYKNEPYVFRANGQEYRVAYTPGESDSGLFGGNSNWRGPVWFPLNYLLIESLERYHHFYGDSLQVECPTGSGNTATLGEVACHIAARLRRIHTPDENGRCAWQGGEDRYRTDPWWRDLTLFHEYFDGDTGRGLGASHQTGWTALVTRLLTDAARTRQAPIQLAE